MGKLGVIRRPRALDEQARFPVKAVFHLFSGKGWVILCAHQVQIRRPFILQSHPAQVEHRIQMLDAAPVDLALADCADIGHRVQLVDLRRGNHAAPICVNKTKPMAAQRRRQLLQRIIILIRGDHKRLHTYILSAEDGMSGASLPQRIVRSTRFPVLKPLVPLYAKRDCQD